MNVTQGQYFLPYVLLLLAGNSPLQRDVYYLLILLASGIGCFLLLRRNGFHLASAVFMGVGWVLSGTMTQNVNALLGQTYATVPWFLLAVDVLLDTLRWRAFGAAAFVMGLCTYSSFLPIIVSAYVLSGIQALVYAITAMTSSVRRGWLMLMAFGGAVSVALGIAAFVLVPLVGAQSRNAAFQATYERAGTRSYSWDVLPTVLSPRLFYDIGRRFPERPRSSRIPTSFAPASSTLALQRSCSSHASGVTSAPGFADCSGCLSPPPSFCWQS